MSTSDISPKNISGLELWFSLGSGPLLWAAFHTLMYAIASLACQQGFWLDPILGSINTLTLVLFALTAVVLGLMTFAGFRAYRNWQGMRAGSRNGIGQPETSRIRFMLFISIAFNLLFGLAVLATFIPVLIFDPCS